MTQSAIDSSRNTRPHWIYLIVASALAWCALLLQMYLTVTLSISNGMSAAAGIVRFFSYFTVTTNTVLAITLTSVIVVLRSRRSSFLARTDVISAVTAYMIVVGVTYSLILRATWHPAGLQLVADRALHDVMPVVAVAYWLLFVPKGELRWRMIAWWLIYPVAYLLYSLAAGVVTGFYPYPFIDVGVLGYPRTLANGAGITIAFVALASLMIGVDALLGRDKLRRMS